MHTRFILFLMFAMLLPWPAEALRVVSRQGDVAVGKIRVKLELIPALVLTIEPSQNPVYRMAPPTAKTEGQMTFDLGRVDALCLSPPTTGYCLPWEDGGGATVVLTFDTSVNFSGSPNGVRLFVEKRGGENMLGEVRHNPVPRQGLLDMPSKSRAGFALNHQIRQFQEDNFLGMKKVTHQLEIDLLQEDHGAKSFDVYYTVQLD